MKLRAEFKNQIILNYGFLGYNHQEYKVRAVAVAITDPKTLGSLNRSVLIF